MGSVEQSGQCVKGQLNSCPGLRESVDMGQVISPRGSVELLNGSQLISWRLGSTQPGSIERVQVEAQVTAGSGQAFAFNWVGSIDCSREVR